jgi:hypothetical protein
MDSRTTPSKNVLDRIRKQYPAGSPVRLVAMDDPHSKLKPGDCGRVGFIDDTGTIFVDWDNGSGLGVVYGVDRVERLDEKNYLKNAELDIEGEEAGYDMIDGIVNNVPSAKDLRDYGYTYEGMTPFDRQGALAMFDKGHEVYLLYEDDTERVADSRKEIENFDGLFGIDKDRPSVIQSLNENKLTAAAAPTKIIKDEPER